jgi:dihydropteroate synthase
MNRKIYFWKLPAAELAMGERTLIMGVLNVTPDSFSDGGAYTDPESAFAHALQMEQDGADIIDIGAESTRPDSKRISADEEWRRLLPVLKLLRDKLTIPLSLDTYKSEIAERALQYGVTIFNDPSGLTFDANLAKVAAEHNAGLILNHMRGTPETWGNLPALSDVMAAVTKDLEATASRARRAGVEKNRIVVDPGLGFGKRKEQNSEILANLSRLAELDYPILAGPSRKSFLSKAAGKDGDAAFATAAAVTIAILNGAHIVRVHDVAEMRLAAQVADEVLRAGVAAEKAVQDAGDRAAAKAARPRPDAGFGNAGFGGEEKARPMRPPLLKRDPPPAPVELPPPAERRDAEPVREERPAARQPERPVFRRPAADRPPQRRDSNDRPPARRDDGDRPRPHGDRPPRPFGDRPQRPFGDRPQRSFGDRPQRSFSDRPPRPDGDRPQRSFSDRPPRPGGDRPQRSFSDRPPRPGGDRPRGDRPSGPRDDRPRDDRPRGFRPGGDRPRPGGEDRPPRNGPPRGGPPRGDRPSRPPGDRPPRPFRKRP